MNAIEAQTREWCKANGIDPDEMIDPLPGINVPPVPQWRLLIADAKKSTHPTHKEGE